MTADDVIDHEARDMAKEAKMRVEAHEDKCEVRWRQNYATLTEIKTGIKSNTQQMWVAQASVIAALLGLVGWLANRAF